jgi:hypothetical protein
MKESVKITVIAAGFREAARRQPHQKPSYLPKTWKASRDQQVQVPNVVQEVAQNIGESIHQVPADDLDVPTFLRRQAQKA